MEEESSNNLTSAPEAPTATPAPTEATASEAPTVSQNNLDEIETVEALPKFDVTGYEGHRVKVQNVEKKCVKDLYPDGKYNIESTSYKWIAELTTEPLVEIIDGKPGEKIVEFSQEEGPAKKLQIHKRFNFQSKYVDGKKVMMKTNIFSESGQSIEVDVHVPVISKHPKASLYAYMKKMGADKLSDLIGKMVTLTTVPAKDPEDDRRFLQIVQ